MADKSNSGWQGMPPEKRLCAGCGERLTLKTAGGLWFDEMRGVVFHHACGVAALREGKRPTWRETHNEFCHLRCFGHDDRGHCQIADLYGATA